MTLVLAEGREEPRWKQDGQDIDCGEIEEQA